MQRSPTIRAPSKRSCERCGREETWGQRRGSWMIAERDGTRLAGDPHCIHEWDINGTFLPYEIAE